MSKSIKYLFIGDLNKKVIMYQDQIINFASSEIDAKQIFEKICKISDHKYYEQAKVPNKNGNYYFTTLSPKRFYFALVDPNYDQTKVFQLFTEVNNSSSVDSVNDYGSINIDGINYLKLITEKYQNKTSNLNGINKDINEIKIEMKQNIVKLVDNKENLEQLNKQSESIKDSAFLFQENSNDLKKQTWWQNCKLWIILILVLLGIIAVIIIVVLVTKNKTKNSNNTTENKDVIVNGKLRLLFEIIGLI